ncbi:MAG: winged helix-turn-helix domain-containing protein [Sodaliphilus sp.]|nr:winged helix-turn-helix domain-containing protein [Sodaliphilus sp.]
MNVETIGLWAGAVWNALNDAKGTLDVKGLKKATKLKEKEVFAAIGWLARESKVNIVADEAEKQVDVTLI